MSPATPSSTNGGGHTLGMHSVSSTSSYGNPGSHSTLSSQIEPSPASTYGSSAASDSSIPLTPDNDGTSISLLYFINFSPSPLLIKHLQCRIIFLFTFHFSRNLISPSYVHTTIPTTMKSIQCVFAVKARAIIFIHVWATLLQHISSCIDHFLLLFYFHNLFQCFFRHSKTSADISLKEPSLLALLILLSVMRVMSKARLHLLVTVLPVVPETPICKYQSQICSHRLFIF